MSCEFTRERELEQGLVVQVCETFRERLGDRDLKEREREREREREIILNQNSKSLSLSFYQKISKQNFSIRSERN